MGKQIIYGEQARQAVLRGINQLAARHHPESLPNRTSLTAGGQSPSGEDALLLGLERDRRCLTDPTMPQSLATMFWTSSG